MCWSPPLVSPGVSGASFVVIVGELALFHSALLSLASSYSACTPGRGLVHIGFSDALSTVHGLCSEVRLPDYTRDLSLLAESFHGDVWLLEICPRGVLSLVLRSLTLHLLCLYVDFYTSFFSSPVLSSCSWSPCMWYSYTLVYRVSHSECWLGKPSFLRSCFWSVGTRFLLCRFSFCGTRSTGAFPIWRNREVVVSALCLFSGFT